MERVRSRCVVLKSDLRRRNTRYKIPQLVAQHEQICCVTSCEFDEKRATKPKSLQPATNVFVARPVDHVW